MSNLTTEQRELLVRQMYSHSIVNRNALSGIQRNRYSIKPNSYEKTVDGKKEDAAPRFGKLRLLIAFLLFFMVLVLDKTNASIAGITAEEIRAIISVDYEQTLDAWVETLASYNSPNK